MSEEAELLKQILAEIRAMHEDIKKGLRNVEEAVLHI